MIKACEHFGGEEPVKEKLFSTLLDLKNEGIFQVEDLPSDASGALRSVSREKFVEMMFISGRELATAFPSLSDLTDEDVAMWSQHSGNSFWSGRSDNRTNRELIATINLQQAALAEVMSSSKEEESPEERAEVEKMRLLLQQLRNR